MTTITRHKENPFLKDLVVTKKSKSVRVSTLGKDDNVLINQHTGEVQGTHVSTYKQVDDAEFVKLFTANIAMTFDLNKSGHKALTLLYWAVQHSAIGKDLVQLNKYTHEQFLEDHPIKAFSMAVFSRGLNELEDAQIIAKAQQRGFYYINPSFIFNGDRVAFTKIIERRNKPEGDSHLQQDLLEGGE